MQTAQQQAFTRRVQAQQNAFASARAVAAIPPRAVAAIPPLKFMCALAAETTATFLGIDPGQVAVHPHAAPEPRAERTSSPPRRRSIQSTLTFGVPTTTTATTTTSTTTTAADTAAAASTTPAVTTTTATTTATTTTTTTTETVIIGVVVHVVALFVRGKRPNEKGAVKGGAIGALQRHLRGPGTVQGMPPFDPDPPEMNVVEVVPLFGAVAVQDAVLLRARIKCHHPSPVPRRTLHRGITPA